MPPLFLRAAFDIEPPFLHAALPLERDIAAEMRCARYYYAPFMPAASAIRWCLRRQPLPRCLYYFSTPLTPPLLPLLCHDDRYYFIRHLHFHFATRMPAILLYFDAMQPYFYFLYSAITRYLLLMRHYFRYAYCFSLTFIADRDVYFDWWHDYRCLLILCHYETALHYGAYAPY